GAFLGDAARLQAFVDGVPRGAGVVGAEGAGGGDGDVHAVRVRWIEEDGVQAHAAGAGLALRPAAVLTQALELIPGLPAVGGFEERGVFHAGVVGIGIGERRLEMPDALDLPGARRAVVPLVRAGHAGVGEVVADGLPVLSAVVGALNLLAEPACALTCVE